MFYLTRFSAPVSYGLKVVVNLSVLACVHLIRAMLCTIGCLLAASFCSIKQVCHIANSKLRIALWHKLMLKHLALPQISSLSLSFHWCLLFIPWLVLVQSTGGSMSRRLQGSSALGAATLPLTLVETWRASEGTFPFIFVVARLHLDHKAV